MAMFNGKTHYPISNISWKLLKYKKGWVRVTVSEGSLGYPDTKDCDGFFGIPKTWNCPKAAYVESPSSTMVFFTYFRLDVYPPWKVFVVHHMEQLQHASATSNSSCQPPLWWVWCTNHSPWTHRALTSLWSSLTCKTGQNWAHNLSEFWKKYR